MIKLDSAIIVARRVTLDVTAKMEERERKGSNRRRKNQPNRRNVKIEEVNTIRMM
jgi:hypothetical protein